MTWSCSTSSEVYFPSLIVENNEIQIDPSIVKHMKLLEKNEENWRCSYRFTSFVQNIVESACLVNKKYCIQKKLSSLWKATSQVWLLETELRSPSSIGNLKVQISREKEECEFQITHFGVDFKSSSDMCQSLSGDFFLGTAHFSYKGPTGDFRKNLYRVWKVSHKKKSKNDRHSDLKIAINGRAVPGEFQSSVMGNLRINMAKWRLWPKDGVLVSRSKKSYKEYVSGKAVGDSVPIRRRDCSKAATRIRKCDIASKGSAYIIF